MLRARVGLRARMLRPAVVPSQRLKTYARRSVGSIAHAVVRPGLVAVQKQCE
jgi:hypothetical protein